MTEWVLKLVQVTGTCKCFHIDAATGMLVVVLLLPLSLAIDKAEAIARGQQQISWLIVAVVVVVVVVVAAVVVAFDSGGSVRQRPHNNQLVQ